MIENRYETADDRPNMFFKQGCDIRILTCAHFIRAIMDSLSILKLIVNWEEIIEKGPVCVVG